MATIKREPKTIDVSTLTPEERATWQMPVAVSNGAALQSMPDEFDDEPEETGVDRISAMLGGASDDERAYIKVQRVVGPNKYAHCDDYSVQSYEAGGLKMIRETWGSGDYDIRLYATNRATGRFGVLKSARVTILAMRDEPINAQNKPQNSELAQVLQTIAQGQQQMLQALTEKPQAPDPMQQFAQMLTLAGTLKDVFGGGNQSQSQLKDIVAAMREMKEAAAEFAPKDKEPDDSPMTMLKPILEMVAASQANRAQQAQVPQMPSVALPAPAQFHQPVAQAANPGDDPVNLDAILMLGHLKRLVTMAAANTDPQEGANLLYEKLPDEFIDLMETPEWFALLSQVEAGVKPHEAWFTKARDLCLAMFARDAAEDAQGAAGAAESAAPGATS